VLPVACSSSADRLHVGEVVQTIPSECRRLPLCPLLPLWALGAAVVVGIAALHPLMQSPALTVPQTLYVQLSELEPWYQPPSPLLLAAPAPPPPTPLTAVTAFPWRSHWVQCGDCDLQEHQVPSVGPGRPDQHPPLLAVLLPVSRGGAAHAGAAWPVCDCSFCQLPAAWWWDSVVPQGCLTPPILLSSNMASVAASATLHLCKSCSTRQANRCSLPPVPCRLPSSPCPPNLCLQQHAGHHLRGGLVRRRPPAHQP
jgi:hypothetical protein